MGELYLFIFLICFFYFWGGEARVTYLYIFSFFRQIRQAQRIKWNKWKARKPSKNSFNYNLLIALLPVTKQIFVFIDTFSLGLSAQFFSLFAHQKEYLSFCFNKSLWDNYRCWLLKMLCRQSDMELQSLTSVSSRWAPIARFDCLLYLEVMIITKLSIREMKWSVNSVFSLC